MRNVPVPFDWKDRRRLCTKTMFWASKMSWILRLSLLHSCWSRRKVHHEASQYYRVTLSITHLRDSGKTAEDNFRTNLSPFLRRAVSKVIVESASGYQGKHINQEQFPNLTSVSVEARVAETLGFRHLIEAVCYRSTLTTMCLDEVWDGSHDMAITAAARKAADSLPMHDVPAVDNRAFIIVCKATAVIFKNPNNGQVDWWVSSNLCWAQKTFKRLTVTEHHLGLRYW